MTALTVEQKIRDRLAENAWRFQHEGSHVVRWLTGGTAPDAYATFEPQGNKVIARCPSCGASFGHFDANYGRAARRQIAALREVGAHHHC